MTLTNEPNRLSFTVSIYRESMTSRRTLFYRLLVTSWDALDAVKETIQSMPVDCRPVIVEGEKLVFEVEPGFVHHETEKEESSRQDSH